MKPAVVLEERSRMFTYLRGLVADAGRSRALGVFGPLSLQVGPDDGVQRKGPADGGLGRPRRCPVHCWWETEEARKLDEHAAVAESLPKCLVQTCVITPGSLLDSSELSL